MNPRAENAFDRAWSVIVLFVALVAVGITAPAAIACDYPAKLVRVTDGDTIEVEVAVWPSLTVRASLRLAGLNAPESRGAVSACEREAGLKAKAFSERFLRERQGPLTVNVAGPDKYGRMLGRARMGAEDLGSALLAAGLARPYAGGRRAPWCAP